MKRRAGERLRGAAGATPAGGSLALGRKLGGIRRRAGLSLKALAERVGCSESLLSKIETGKANPSLAMLHRIVAALDISMAALFEPDGRGKTVVYRAGTRPRLDVEASRGKKIVLEQLIPDSAEHLLQANIHIVYPRGASRGEITHEGEEAGYVLEGDIELIVDGRAYNLGPGDFFVFPSSLPHQYRNRGRAIGRILWVNTPVTF